MSASGNITPTSHSAKPSKHFFPLLLSLEKELTVPYPERKELIDELSSHLNDLFIEFLNEGFAHDEAAKRSVCAMALDQEFISSIDEVHRPIVARALAKLPPRVALGVEYTGIGLLAVFINILIFSQEETMIEILLDGGVFMIPINLMGLVVMVLTIERTYSLFVKKDHSSLNIRRRLLSFRFLGLACTLTGVIATLIGLFQAFSAVPEVSEKFGGTFPIFEVCRIAMTTTIWGMTISLISLCAYYVVKAKASRIEESQLS